MASPNDQPTARRRIDSTLVNVEDLTCLEGALAWACDRLARDLAEPLETAPVQYTDTKDKP